MTPLQRKHELNVVSGQESLLSRMRTLKLHAQVDVFEVNLKVDCRNGLLMMPEELHDCKSGLVMEVPSLTVHLRNHDYYMGRHDAKMADQSRYGTADIYISDLVVDADPIAMVFERDLTKLSSARPIAAPTPQNRLYLDKLVITAHRLFGPVRSVACGSACVR